jgi:hypothetical protein
MEFEPRTVDTFEILRPTNPEDVENTDMYRVKYEMVSQPDGANVIRESWDDQTRDIAVFPLANTDLELARLAMQSWLSFKFDMQWEYAEPQQ